MANRGEIAIRVFRTLREMGIGSVAVYSEADRESPFVAYADEAYLIGPGPAAQSYLMSETIVRTALRSGAEAVHPGFGFLAENAAFARACAAAGLVFVGPPPDAIEAMGSKISARALMQQAGVPGHPRHHRPRSSTAEARARGRRGGSAIRSRVKAAAGGGGKGIEVAAGADELPARATSPRGGRARRTSPTTRCSSSATWTTRGTSRCRCWPTRTATSSTSASATARSSAATRRSSRRRRRRRSTPELRERIGAIGVEAARAVGYVNAGTVEGLLDPATTYFFLEMNTRLQVEHTITEMVTGLDLVREQLRIACGEPLSIAQEDVELRGHSIQCRINAEDPLRDFVPTPGRVTRYREPSGPGRAGRLRGGRGLA